MAANDLKGSEPLFLLVLAALAGVVVTTTVDRGSTREGTAKPENPKLPANPPQPSGTPPAAVDATDVLAVLERELSYSAGATCANGASCEGPRLQSLTVVIALLPDPATSGFIGEFDHGLDAILESAQSQRFTVVRHWLPWERDGATLKARAEADRAGWVLLRDDREGDARYRVLLVLVVGERLGAGVQGSMLRNALDVRSRLRTKTPLLILGPTFSGTAASLREGLEAWCHGKPDAACDQRAEIISGTATRLLNARILETTRGWRVRFQATVNPDDALGRTMHLYLSTALKVEERHIAQLTEATTPFGVDASKTSLSISFPAHVPDQRRLSADPTKPSPALQENEVSVDAVPLLTFSGLVESKQLLGSTIEALRSRGITDVGVLATGTNDKISLVAALRRAASDIRPHILEANLTLADPEAHQVMDGTLVASSYPLTPMTQIWSSRPDVLPFASDAAEGVHNALVALFWRGGLIDAAQLTASLRDYRFPFGKEGKPAGPPIWISVILGGRVWPLALYPDQWKEAGAYGYVFGRPRVPEAPPPAPQPQIPKFEHSRFATILLLLLLVLVACNLLAVVRPLAALRRCPFLLFYQPASDPPAVTPGEGKPARAARASDQFDGLLHLDLLRDASARPALLMGIWVASLVGWTAATLYEFPTLLSENPGYGAGDLVAVLLFVASTLLLFVPFRALGSWIRSAVHAALIAAAVSTAIPILSSFIGQEENTDGRAFFFFVRLMSPTVGLTPAPPLAVMAIALYVASLFRLRVVRRANRLSATTDRWDSALMTGARRGLRDFAKQALRSLTPILWLGAGLGAMLFVWRGMRPRSLEGASFDLLVTLGFGVMFAVALGSLWRANRLYRRLTAYLRKLAVHPLAPAFGTLPAHVAQTFRTPMPGPINREEIDEAAAVASQLAENNAVEHPGATKKGGEKEKETEAHPDASASATPADEGERQVHQYLAELAPTWQEAGVRPPALRARDAPRPPLAVELREHILALRMTESISMMCDATRTTLFVGSVAAMAAVLATASYPFQPIETLRWAARISILISVVVGLRVIAGIERDDILSRIAGTDPGKMTLSWSLALRLLGYVIVPLGTLAATHLPDRGELGDLLRFVGSSSPR